MTLLTENGNGKGGWTRPDQAPEEGLALSPSAGDGIRFSFPKGLLEKPEEPELLGSPADWGGGLGAAAALALAEAAACPDPWICP